MNLSRDDALKVGQSELTELINVDHTKRGQCLAGGTGELNIADRRVGWLHLRIKRWRPATMHAYDRKIARQMVLKVSLEQTNATGAE